MGMDSYIDYYYSNTQSNEFRVVPVFFTTSTLVRLLLFVFPIVLDPYKTVSIILHKR